MRLMPYGFTGRHIFPINIDWTFRNFTLLSTIISHAENVTAFAAVPENSGMRIKHGVASVGRDQAVCIVDLDSLEWFGTFFIFNMKETSLQVDMKVCVDI